MIARLEIGRAQAGDLAAVLRLLQLNHLPTDGLQEHFANALVARHEGELVGSAALEIYPDGALLRSVAVDPSLHGQRIGHELTQSAIDLARELAAPAIFLLTTTAADFFPKFGFERIPRSDVPASVQTSVEFTSACPSTATVMRRIL